MRRWIIAALLLVGGFAFACAELVGVHDLSCGSEGGSPDPCGDGYVPPPPCVPDGGPFDTCVGDGGITILLTNGEVHGVAWADGMVVAVGYDAMDSGTGLSIRALSKTGDVVDTIIEDAGMANAVAVDQTLNSVWVAGGDGTSFIVRYFKVGPLKLDQSGNFAIAKDTQTPLRESVAIVPGGEQTVFGTSTTDNLVIERLDDKAGHVHDIVYNNASIAVRATSGVTSTAGMTILGDTPDAALGLAMARFLPGPVKDPSFGDAGALVAKFGGGGSARSLLNASDGVSYWVGGVAAGDGGFVLAHVTEAGVLDQSWTVAHAQSGANAMLAVDGGLLAAGFADGNLAIARFTLDAGIDTTFGDAGVLEIPMPGELKAIVQTDTRYVAGGFAMINGTKRWVLVWLIP